MDFKTAYCFSEPGVETVQVWKPVLENQLIINMGLNRFAKLR